MSEPVSREQVEKLIETHVEGSERYGRREAAEQLRATFDALTAAREQAERISNNMHAQIKYMIDEITKALKLEGTWTPADVVDAVRNLVPMIEQIDAMKAAREQDRQRMEKLESQADLWRDEFRRIHALGPSDEVKGICERALLDIVRHVPVVYELEVRNEQLLAAQARCAEVEQDNEYYRKLQLADQARYRDLSEALKRQGFMVAKVGEQTIVGHPQFDTLTTALQQAKGALEAVWKMLNCSDETPFCNDRTVTNLDHFDCHHSEIMATVQQALAALPAAGIPNPVVKEIFTTEVDTALAAGPGCLDCAAYAATWLDGCANPIHTTLPAGPVVGTLTDNMGGDVSDDKTRDELAREIVGEWAEAIKIYGWSDDIVVKMILDAIEAYEKEIVSLDTNNSVDTNNADHLVDANKMVWTDAKPTVPGEYWFLGPQRDVRPFMVDVVQDGDCLWGQWFTRRGHIHGRYIEHMNGQWCPIPLPPDGEE